MNTLLRDTSQKLQSPRHHPAGTITSPNCRHANGGHLEELSRSPNYSLNGLGWPLYPIIASECGSCECSLCSHRLHDLEYDVAAVVSNRGKGNISGSKINTSVSTAYQQQMTYCSG